jgi:membrane fusion protein (multidrug efflux system)
MATDAFVCGANRTPFGRHGVSLGSVRADDLAAMPIRAPMQRNPKVDRQAVADGLQGCANRAGEDTAASRARRRCWPGHRLGGRARPTPARAAGIGQKGIAARATAAKLGRIMRSVLSRTLALATAAVLLVGCGKEAPRPPSAPLEVSLLAVQPRDVDITAEYVAQTQSSQAVNIQARVSGFLDKRVYTEGSVVKAGQVLFRMDQKPFQAQVDAAQAALQRNQAAMTVAKQNLDRTKPLAAKNALSQKDLDDAQGQYEQSAAAVEQSKAQLQSAKLDLSYTVISSPVNGVSSFAAVADGTYLSPQNSQLTTVSVLSPMWVNFSLSENEFQRIMNDVKAGRLRLPKDNDLTVEIVQPDGSLFPFTGRITFADPSYNPQTGTFLLRATVQNPKGVLRPNQYVRARLKGAVRPNALLVPQRAVQQGGKGHFVWLVDKDGKALLRPVTVGDWYGDGWFVTDGLHAGDQLVVDGAQRLSQGAAVIVKARDGRPVAASPAAAAATASAPPGSPAAPASPPAARN